MQKTTRYGRFTFVGNTISNSSKAPRTEFLGCDRLFCFISICKFGSFKNPFATITSLCELYFKFRKFILLVQTINFFYEIWQQNKQLKTWYLRWGIYASIPTWTYLQNLPPTAEALSLKISSHRISLEWPRRLSQSARE